MKGALVSVSIDELAVLVAEYEQGRDDERSFLAVQAGLFGFALAALGTLGALIQGLRSPDGLALPDGAIACTPFIVIALVLYAQSLGEQAILRSFYLRVIEREVRLRLPALSATSYTGLHAFSWSEIETEYRDLRGGAGYFRIMTGGIVMTLVLIFGGATFLLASEVSLPWQLAMGYTFGGGSVIAFFRAIDFTRNGRKKFAAYVSRANIRIGIPLTPSHMPAAPSRNLGIYAVIPHPDDLIKSVFTASGVVIGLAIGTSAVLGEILLLSAAFELLVYQARYQWNDIRGQAEDLSSPMSQGRGRLPASSQAITISTAVLLSRLFAMILICTISWRGVTWSVSDLALTVATLATALVAITYEAVRAYQRKRSRCSRAGLAALLLLVGVGYPLRTAAGLFIAAPDLPGGMVLSLVIGALAIGSLGILFVVMTWCLEATSYGALGATLPTQLQSLSQQIEVKPHLLQALKASGIAVPPLSQTPPADGASWRMFIEPGIPRLSSWTTVLGTSIGAFVALAFTLISRWEPIFIASGGCLLIATAATTLLPAQMYRRKVAVCVTASLTAAVSTIPILSPMSYTLSIAPFAPCWIYLAFARVNYAQTRDLPSQVTVRLRAVASWVKRYYLGN